MPEATVSTPATSLQAVLSRGRLDVQVATATWPAASLVGFAERRNPKRAFLFVSKVLGRHIPVSPIVMRAAFTSLAAAIPTDLPGPVLVVGMAETAVGLGAGVHQALGRADAVYWATTRHATGTPVLAQFAEEHSHATRHLLHRPLDPAVLEQVQTARSLVLVDDEASTGRTFVNLVQALEAAGLSRIERIVTATLTDWSDAAATKALGPRASAVSLLSGRWAWQPDPDALPVTMPAVDVTARGAWEANLTRDWGRLGVQNHVHTLRGRVTAKPGERILVLGSSEYVWPPFLLAEDLAAAGAHVEFGATTRSPIALGHAIGEALAFTDNYGLGIPNFVYNIHPAKYDRIVLCVETGAAMVDPTLCHALRPEIVTDDA